MLSSILSRWLNHCALLFCKHSFVFFNFSLRVTLSAGIMKCCVFMRGDCPLTLRVDNQQVMRGTDRTWRTTHFREGILLTRNQCKYISIKSVVVRAEDTLFIKMPILWFGWAFTGCNYSARAFTGFIYSARTTIGY